MTNAPRDANRVPTLLGVSSLDLITPTSIAVNPATGAMLIDGTSLYTTLDARYLKLSCSNNPLTGELDLPGLFNSVGSLKIMPDAQGNVDLFGDTDVANDANGKTFSVNRRAAEGDTTLSLYVDDARWANIGANWDIKIHSDVVGGEIQLGTVNTNVVRLVGDVNTIGLRSSGTGTENLPLRHYGYITAGGLSGQKYVQWQINDTGDYFHLTRQSDSIVGFKVEMPLMVVGGLNLNVTVVTDTYQVLVTDYTVVCNKATAFTVTLPTAVVGAIFNIKNIGAGTITLVGNPGTDTIDGDVSIQLIQWDAVQVQCYLANKWVIV